LLIKSFLRLNKILRCGLNFYTLSLVIIIVCCRRASQHWYNNMSWSLEIAGKYFLSTISATATTPSPRQMSGEKSYLHMPNTYLRIIPVQTTTEQVHDNIVGRYLMLYMDRCIQYNICNLRYTDEIYFLRFSASAFASVYLRIIIVVNWKKKYTHAHFYT